MKTEAPERVQHGSVCDKSNLVALLEVDKAVPTREAHLNRVGGIRARKMGVRTGARASVVWSGRNSLLTRK